MRIRRNRSGQQLTNEKTSGFEIGEEVYVYEEESVITVYNKEEWRMKVSRKLRSFSLKNKSDVPAKKTVVRKDGTVLISKDLVLKVT